MSNGIGVFFSTCCPHPHYGRQCPSQYFHLATSSCSLIFRIETMTKESEKPPKVSTRNAEGSPTGNVVRLRTNSSGQQQQSKEQSEEPDTPKKSSNNKSKSEKQSGSGGGGGGGGGSSGGNSPSGRQQQDSQSQQSKRNMGPTNHSSSNSNSNGHQDDNGGGGNNGGGQVNGVRSQEPPPRNRCRCWCCCCSCSCLALRNNEENRPKPKDSDSDLICDQDVPPTLEEIRSWGESFDKLMRSAAGRKVLREFLKCEYSEENILFWLACEDLKKESKPELIEEKARLIYEDYISILSPKEVSLDSRVREVVNQNMVDPSPHTFDEAQVQIYTLMHRDSYPRFVNSPLYKKLAQLQTTHRGSSVSASNPASRKESLVS